MINKKELNKIYWLRREIKMWEDKLAELENKSQTTPSGEPHGSGISDKTGRQATAIADTKIIIEGLLAQIRQAEADITQFVTELDDPFLRQIIMYRCYDCYTWVKVAHKMHTTEDTVKNMYYRFVRKLES